MDKLKTLLRHHSSLLAYAGLLVLLIAVTSYVVSQQLDVVVQALLFAGAFLLIVYLVLESRRVSASLRGRTARYGTNSLLMSVAFIGIMVMINALGARHHWRWDVTASRQYSLSEQTINILNSLEEPVKVTAFFSTANPYQIEQQETLENLLKSYQLYTDKLTYAFIDPDIQPGLARQYGITSYGTVIFERGEKKQQTTTIDEQSLTSALLKVSRDVTKKVYFLSGHKERDPEETGDSGYSMVKSYLEKNNYEVSTLNLAITNTVPSDMDVLVLASPQVPLRDEEIEIIDGYLQGGGKALVLTDPTISNPFGDLLSPWGLEVRDDLVVDPVSSFPQDASALVVTRYDFPNITRGVEGLITFFPGVRSIAAKEDITDTLTVSPVIQTSEASWGETDYAGDSHIRMDEGKDARGPLSIAMAVTSSETDTRIVVFGDSEFPANGALLTVRGTGNQDLFADAIDWLAEEEELVSISPKPPEQRTLFLPPGSSRFVVFSSLIILPLAVIVAGIAVWWSRR